MIRRTIMLVLVIAVLAACAGPATPQPTAAPTSTMAMSTGMDMSTKMPMGGMDMGGGAPVPTVTPGVPAEIPAAAPDLGAYPVTIQNCGRTLTFTKPPERVVPLYPLTAEFLLRLGLKDRIVSTGQNEGDPPAPDLTADFQNIPALSTDLPPSKEVLLNAHPDFVIDNFPSFFYDESSGRASIAQLSANGAEVYTLTSRCDGYEAKGKVTDLYTDIANLGKIFGISDRAQQLSDQLKSRVAAVQTKIAGKPKVRVLIYDSGIGPINVFGPGAISDVVAQAGGENVFADQPREYAMLSAEVVASRDPEVFIISERQSKRGMSMGKDLNVQEASDFLLKTFPNTSAAKNKRVVVIPYQQIYASLQNIDGIEALAKAFYPDAFMEMGMSASYPVTIQNCGRTLTFTKAPERVISMWQSPTEMLLALGLQDKIIALAGSYAPYSPEFQVIVDKIKVIGTVMTWPQKEVTLSLKPDFVISELLEGYAFDSSLGYASVADLEAAGAQVYSNNACTDKDILSKKIDNVYVDLANLGKIFGVSDKAEALNKQMKDRQAAVEKAVSNQPKVKVAFYNGGTGPINIFSGGVYGDVISRAGGENVFKTEGFQVSIEEFAAAQPDVILVGFYPGQEAEASIAFLKKTFPNIPAVKNNRFVPIANIQMEASVYIVEGLEQIAKGLHPEAFK